MLDHPSAVTVAAGFLVALHWYLARRWPVLNFWTDLAPTPDARTTYLALAGAAAISAGFAGVVLVFGLSVDTPVFRKFRRAGSERLRASWFSIIGSAFGATALSLGAGIFADTAPAPWIFEFGLLLWAHGVLRMMFFVYALAKLVQADDERTFQQARVVKSEDLFQPRAS